jgi:hypothetical protein
MKEYFYKEKKICLKIDLMKKIFTKKRKASMMDILATASCKSL